MFTHVSWESFNGYMHSHPFRTVPNNTLGSTVNYEWIWLCTRQRSVASLRINDNGSMITSYALLYIDVLWTQVLGAETYTRAGIFSH